MAITTVSNSSVTVQQNLTTTTAAIAPNMNNPGAGNSSLLRGPVTQQSTTSQLQEIVQNLAHAEQIVTIAGAGGAPNVTNPNSGNPTGQRASDLKRNVARNLFNTTVAPNEPKNDLSTSNKCECVKTRVPEKLQETVLIITTAALTQTQTKKVPVTPNKAYKSMVHPLHHTPSKDPLEKPEWFPEAHRFMRDLAKKNTGGSIADSEIQKVRALAHQIMASGNSDDYDVDSKAIISLHFCGSQENFLRGVERIA